MAKVALLKGARKVVRGKENFIRHGNVDYKNCTQSSKVTGFLYPQLKSPALVRWDEDTTKTIKFKLTKLFSW
jgi:hypothetical protein